MLWVISLGFASPASSNTPALYSVRIVVYMRQQNVTAVKEDDTAEGAMKAALSAVERQVRDDPERQLQAHATKGATTGGARPALVYHGHGAGTLEENEKKDILRFFQMVDRGLQDYLAGERAPLVLAGVDYLHPIFREASSYPYLTERGIYGNPDDQKLEELHHKAWEILEPHFRKDQEEAAALYQQQAGMETGRASREISEVVPAAYYGRVSHLFVLEGESRWGTFDPMASQVSLHARDLETPEDMDLLDFAAEYTYLNNGAVYIVQPGDMPDSGPCAAVLRY